jgi:hypothetical protein
VDGLLPLPEYTDEHVAKTRHTTAGMVAHYHVGEKKGTDAFDANEVDPVYPDGIWHAVESPESFNICPVAGRISSSIFWMERVYMRRACCSSYSEVSLGITPLDIVVLYSLL